MRRLAPLLMLLLAVPAAAEHGPGESGAWPARLPHATSAAAVATDGTAAYLFGGYGNGQPLDVIQRLDPRHVDGTSVVGRLPAPLLWATAAWAGEAAYVFGGQSEGQSSDAIVRFDPRTNETRVMTTRLPFGVEGAMAASDGTSVVLVAGNAVLRYHPADDALDILPIRMPANLSGGSAVWAQGRLIAFGAMTPGGVETDRILIVDPDAGTATFAESRLPSPRTHVAAMWTGSRAYVLGGGTDATPEHADVLQYDAANDSLRVLETTMPSARSRAAAAFVHGRAYLMGGAEQNGPVLDEVWRFTPPQPHAADGPQPPVARLRLHADLLLVTADATASTDPDGRIVTYRVEWGDGDESASATGNLTHHYPLPGSYRVRLTVVDERGLAASAEQEVTLALPLPPLDANATEDDPPDVDPPPELPEGDAPGGSVPTVVWVAVGFAAVGGGAVVAARVLK